LLPAEFRVAQLLFAYARLRASELRDQRGERGASAVEWAIISAIVVTAAVLIGLAIKGIVQGKRDEMCSQDDVSCG
jgi:Flp pilus assembly pilin Flp